MLKPQDPMPWWRKQQHVLNKGATTVTTEERGPNTWMSLLHKRGNYVVSAKYHVNSYTIMEHNMTYKGSSGMYNDAAIHFQQMNSSNDMTVKAVWALAPKYIYKSFA